MLASVAPIVFVVHWMEEAPGFVAWFNAHVPRGITQELFTQVNVSALVITLAVAAIAWFDDSAASAIAAVAWLSFLMGGNALLHITGAIADGRYMPGVVTAVLLYVPYYAAMMFHAKRRGVSAGLLIALAVAGAAPMLIHGYRIIFLGTRLF